MHVGCITLAICYTSIMFLNYTMNNVDATVHPNTIRSVLVNLCRTRESGRWPGDNLESLRKVRVETAGGRKRESGRRGHPRRHLGARDRVNLETERGLPQKIAPKDLGEGSPRLEIGRARSRPAPPVAGSPNCPPPRQRRLPAASSRCRFRDLFRIIHSYTNISHRFAAVHFMI